MSSSGSQMTASCTEWNGIGTRQTKPSVPPSTSAARRSAQSRRRASEPAPRRCFQPRHSGISNELQALTSAIRTPTKKYFPATNQIMPSVTLTR